MGLLTCADSVVKGYCQVPLETQPAVYEYRNGNQMPDLWLRRRPIRFYLLTGNLTSGLATITNLAPTSGILPQPSVNPSSPTGYPTGLPLLVGMPVQVQYTTLSGSPIPAGTTIASVDSSTQVTMSQTATVSVTGQQFVFGMSLYLNSTGYAGQGNTPLSTQYLLFLGKDYMILPDQDDGSCKSGTIKRLSGGPSGDIYAYPWNWQLRSGTLTARSVPTWSNWYGNIQAVYTAGWGTGPNMLVNPTSGSVANLPQDLVVATAQVVAWMKRNVPLGGELNNESLGSYSYGLHFPSPGQPPEVGSIRQILGRYREAAFGGL